MSNYNQFTGIKGNRYDLSGEYGIGYASNTNEPFYFDLEDYDKICQWTWNARHDRREGREDSLYYIEAHYRWREDGKKKSKRIHLHHLVLGIDDKTLLKPILVDHKNRVPYDCRKENLQLASLRVNNINKPIQKSNTSGFIGVEWNERQQCWISRINITAHNRETVYHGDNKYDAVVARLVAEYKHYGQDAPQRHLFEEYGITKEFVEKYPVRKYRYRNNTSGITGVSQRLDGVWVAYINSNRKHIMLYQGNSKEEAVRARLQAEIQYLPKWLQQKELFEQYGVKYDE